MKSGIKISAFILLTGFVIFTSCKKDKETTTDVNAPANPDKPPPFKTITATVLEYGTDLPVAGANILTCNSPLSATQCSGPLISLMTDNNGRVNFTTQQYVYRTVEKDGYFQNIFNPCFIKYHGTDSTSWVHSSDFTVRMVPKTDFTLHIRDISGTNGTGISLVANVNFHGCSSSQDVLRLNLRSGIDTIVTLRDYWGNSSYLLRVGNNYDPGCSCFATEYYNQTKFVVNGATNFFDINF